MKNEYKILTMQGDWPVLLEDADGNPIDALKHMLEIYGEKLPVIVSKTCGGYEWDVISHSVTFVQNQPVLTILLCRDHNDK